MSKAGDAALRKLLERGGEFKLDADLPGLQAGASDAGLTWCVADCDKARSWSAVFRCIVKAVDFPEYFSNGFDGFYDCLCDTLLDQKAGIVLIFEKLHSADPAIVGDGQRFLQILSDTVDFAQEIGKIFVYAIEHAGKHAEAAPGVVHNWSDEPS